MPLFKLLVLGNIDLLPLDADIDPTCANLDWYFKGGFIPVTADFDRLIEQAPINSYDGVVIDGRIKHSDEIVKQLLPAYSGKILVVRPTDNFPIAYPPDVATGLFTTCRHWVNSLRAGTPA